MLKLSKIKIFLEVENSVKELEFEVTENDMNQLIKSWKMCMSTTEASGVVGFMYATKEGTQRPAVFVAKKIIAII